MFQIYMPAELTVASKLFPFATKKSEVNNSVPDSQPNAEISSSSVVEKPLFTPEKPSSFILSSISLPAVGYSLSALDPSSGLDKAAELVTDAALRAIMCNPSPSLQSAISWMRTMSREHVHELDNGSSINLDEKPEFNLGNSKSTDLQNSLIGENVNISSQELVGSSIDMIDSNKNEKKRARDL